MIQHDLISWIVNVLKTEKETLSDYSYEYATALFMNLSLRTQGKKKCEEEVSLTFSHEPTQADPYMT